MDQSEDAKINEKEVRAIVGFLMLNEGFNGTCRCGKLIRSMDEYRRHIASGQCRGVKWCYTCARYYRTGVRHKCGSRCMDCGLDHGIRERCYVHWKISRDNIFTIPY